MLEIILQPYFSRELLSKDYIMNQGFIKLTLNACLGD